MALVKESARVTIGIATTYKDDDCNCSTASATSDVCGNDGYMP